MTRSGAGSVRSVTRASHHVSRHSGVSAFEECANSPSGAFDSAFGSAFDEELTVGENQHGFESFATARAAALFRTAWLLTGDFQLAEDLVQETLAKVYLHWRRVARMDNPAAYARTVLVHAHASHRRLRRNSELPAADLPASVPGSVEADDPGLRLTLLDGLARLTPTDRSVLVLRYWEDLDVKATADLLRM